MIDLDKLPADVTNHIINFKNLLVATYSQIDLLMKDHDWDDDIDLTGVWEEISWELFVGRELLQENGYLKTLSVRNNTPFLDQRDQSTHAIGTQISTNLIDARTQKPIPKNCWLRIVGFLSPYKDGGFGWYPPFNFAKLVLDSKKKEIFITPIEELKFYLIKLD